MKATIRALNLYPIKGCRGVALRAARLAATGLEHEEIGDREWVVVDEHGEFLSQRELPRMALIETRLTGSSMLLKAPGMLQLEVPYESEGDVVRVRVWDDTIPAVTQGEIADAWFTSFLGRPGRLVRFDPEARRLSNHRYTGKFDAPYKFADAFALLVTGQASLDDFNARLAAQGHAAIAMERFRPNVVLDGLPAFDEDYAKTLRVDGAELRVVKPCARCTVPGVDPATGEASNVVPDLLATYRRRENGVMFGVNAIVVEGAGAWLAVGDEVEVELDL
ncbi:MAG: MOSC N-terminal beta barrel domain-containing protein [Burkholderiaceae bacterium]|nr:MOSC N-terminal beta barrel domain-containing protein [Burkholderiaceae bacterium]